ncbi:hypothetical protein GCM10023307_16970 [Lysobacter hankyongensis]|uniref:ROK family protein n=1 Tax=Lysobacter hankyongensis TaxID=1176535 RepID=A0ABP9BCB3_9GAMM
MHPVVALDMGLGVGKALFDELADGLGGHVDAVSEGRRGFRGAPEAEPGTRRVPAFIAGAGKAECGCVELAD